MDSAAFIALLDGLACALLAAAACCRARIFGVHFTGSVTLGCICGLLGPLAREMTTYGAAGSRAVLHDLPGFALAGALAAICVLARGGRYAGRLFFWLDSAGLGLAGSLGAVLTLPECGITAALLIGSANALAPGFVRDIALGDTAMLVEKDWYAMAAFIGCLVSAFILAAPLLVSMPDFWAGRLAEAAIASGTLTVICLRVWRGEKGEMSC